MDFHNPANEVVALSADCQESTKMLCLGAGMNAFLSKPLKKSKFWAITLDRKLLTRLKAISFLFLRRMVHL